MTNITVSITPTLAPHHSIRANSDVYKCVSGDTVSFQGEAGGTSPTQSPLQGV